MTRFENAIATPRPLIGMLHAPPLLGSPRYGGDPRAVLDHVLADAAVLVEHGVHALLLENFGDAPFHAERVEPETVAALTTLACAVRGRWPHVPLGINVLRNDAQAALVVAAAAGCAFLRVNVLCGTRSTDQGLITGPAAKLLRDRSRLHATSVAILADVDVKHSAPLADRALVDEVREMLDRGGADALIVTGRATGDATALETLQAVVASAGDAPVLIGSGITAENLATYAPWAGGFIVGSSLKPGGRIEAPVAAERVGALRRAWDQLPAADARPRR